MGDSNTNHSTSSTGTGIDGVIKSWRETKRKLEERQEQENKEKDKNVDSTFDPRSECAKDIGRCNNYQECKGLGKCLG